VILKKFKSPDWYLTNFGDSLIIADILQRIYPAVGKILQSSASRNPASKRYYESLLLDFENEVRLAENDNRHLLGTPLPPVEKFVLH
jgi:hypothetical protein